MMVLPKNRVVWVVSNGVDRVIENEYYFIWYVRIMLSLFMLLSKIKEVREEWGVNLHHITLI